MHIEQRLEKVERQNRNQRMAVILLTVVLCGMVTMAATGGEFQEVGNFGTVITKEIYIHDGAGIQLFQMGKDVYGNGWVETRSAGGKALVRLHEMQDSSRCTGSITADGWRGRTYYIS